MDSIRDPETGNHFMAMTGMTGILGIVITLSVLCCVSIGGPITVNTSGTLKDVILTYIGFIFFDDIQITPHVGVGLALSFLGAIN